MKEKILIVAPSWVGDLVMAQSLLQHLVALRPQIEIDLLVPAYCEAIAAFMPEVHATIIMPIGHGRLALKERWKLAKAIQEKGYTEAIVLPNSFKSALVPFLAKIPKRTGWAGEFRYGLLNDIRKLSKKRYPSMIDRFVALAYPKKHPWPLESPFLLPKLMVDRAKATEQFDRMGLSEHPSVIALAPGAAFGSAKCWPPSYFAALARHFLDQNKQVWILGGPKDEATLEQVHLLAGKRTRILGGNYPLDQKIIALMHVKALVSNDSGLLHVGAALGLPVVGIYGSTPSSLAPPLSQKARIVERTDLACRPCLKRDCPLSGPAHLACLKGISPEHVAQVVFELLQSKEVR